MEIRDDGVGLSEDALTAFQKGIGVFDARGCSISFGADYRFEFHRLSQGVAVIVVVPWRVKRPEQPTEADQASRISGTPGIRAIRAAS